MEVGDLTGPERRLWEAFSRGEPVELGGGNPTAEGATGDDWPAPQRVRGVVVSRLLLGAVPAEPGFTPKMILSGARITGSIDVSGGTVACELRLVRCWLDEPFEAGDATLRNVTLDACRVTRIQLWAADVDGSLRVTSSRVGELNLGSAAIADRLHLSGSTLANPGGRALTGTRMTVGHSMICRGTSISGELRLLDAQIGTALILTGATLSNPEGRALGAAGITVEQTVYFTKGFRATGEVRLRRARIHGLLLIDGRVDGVLNLGDAQVHTLAVPASRSIPARLDGLTYQHLTPELLEGQRIRWLQRDPDGDRAQPYEQLADHYRRLGYDRRARLVLLAKRRAHNRNVPLHWRVLGWAQDALSGYGYAPGRAVGWLLAAWAIGAGYFAVDPPDDRGGFHATLYALDVLLPTSPLRLEDQFAPDGVGFWLAVGMQAFGWALSIAVLPALTRALGRS